MRREPGHHVRMTHRASPPVDQAGSRGRLTGFACPPDVRVWLDFGELDQAVAGDTGVLDAVRRMFT